MTADIITWVTDKIIDLLKMHYDDKKERFQKLYEPMFDNLTLIHHSYTKMFHEVINLLPVHKTYHDNPEQVKALVYQFNEKNDITGRNETEIGTNDYQANIDRAMQALRDKRIDNLHLRTQVRTFAAEFFSKTENEDEMRFLWTVINYFLNYKRDFHTTDDIATVYDDADFIVERIKSGNFDIHSITRTPSSYVEAHIFKTYDADFISKQIKSVLYDLDKFYIAMCRRFIKLKFDAYNP